MDDGGPIERRTGWDRRGPGERRRNPDRRCEPDRRGNPSARTEPSAKTEASDGPRSYGFRSFVDRRGRAEGRRNPAAGGDRRKTEDRRDGVVWQDDVDVQLTPEEVLALLHDPRDEED
jgi:hypothetical protein